jgi:hypothetical protein
MQVTNPVLIATVGFLSLNLFLLGCGANPQEEGHTEFPENLEASPSTTYGPCLQEGDTGCINSSGKVVPAETE